MRDYLRDIREVQSAAYLSQVINDVVPLEDDVSLARARTSATALAAVRRCLDASAAHPSPSS